MPNSASSSNLVALGHPSGSHRADQDAHGDERDDHRLLEPVGDQAHQGRDPEDGAEDVELVLAHRCRTNGVSVLVVVPERIAGSC